MFTIFATKYGFSMVHGDLGVSWLANSLVANGMERWFGVVALITRQRFGAARMFQKVSK